MEPLGMIKRPDEEEIARHQAEIARLYDKLFEHDEFVEFLKGVALRSGMFRPSAGPRGEWYEGYSAALRDIVNHAVIHATKGEAMLARIISDNNKKREAMK